MGPAGWTAEPFYNERGRGDFCCFGVNQPLLSNRTHLYVGDGTELDTDFQQNWQGIASAGLIRGAYQYFEPGEDPTTQANIMINAIGAAGPGHLPPVLDLETPAGNPRQQYRRTSKPGLATLRRPQVTPR